MVDIVFEGNTRFDNSYGIVNLNLANALRARGHQVAFTSYDEDEDGFLASCTQLGIAPFPLRPVGVGDVCIREFWPPKWDRPACQKFIVIQPWEFGGVPLAWIDKLDQVDQVWAYTQFVKSCWVEGGADPAKIRVVPLGVHQSSLSQGKKAPGQLLFLGGGIWRKGVDLFVMAVDGLSDDELAHTHVVIKESGNDSFYRNQSLVDMMLDKFPRVRAVTEVCRDSLSRAELDLLIAQSVALVHPYRAEGFYLGGLEAMSLGTAVVMTQGGAADDYANDQNALMIRATHAIGDGDSDGDLGPIGGEFHWMEASVDDLTRAIRMVLTDDPSTQADVQARIERAYQTSRRFSWDQSAQYAESAIASERVENDHFSQVEEGLARVLDTWSLSDLDAVTALMVQHQDFHGAHELLARFGKALPPNAQAMSDQLLSLLPGRIDIWRDARYRVALQSYARGGSRGVVGAISHRCTVNQDL